LKHSCYIFLSWNKVCFGPREENKRFKAKTIHSVIEIYSIHSSSGAIQHGGRQLQSAHFRLHSEPPDALSSLSVYQWVDRMGIMARGKLLYESLFLFYFEAWAYMSIVLEFYTVFYHYFYRIRIYFVKNGIWQWWQCCLYRGAFHSKKAYGICGFLKIRGFFSGFFRIF
jgi:hypothetical protein